MNEIPNNGPVAHALTVPAAAVRPATAVRNAPAERGAEVEPAAKPDTPAVPAAAQAVKQPPPLAASTRTTAYSDPSSGRYVIQVREAESDELINQYPPKELLRFYAVAREALEQAVSRSTDGGEDVSA